MKNFILIGMLATMSLAPAYADDDDMKKSQEDVKAISDYEALKKYSLTGAKDRQIQLNQVMRTRILDDRTIVFFMRNNKAYVNRMKYDCAGLKHEDRFAYDSFNGLLTSMDKIWVIDDFGRQNTVCGLEEFVEFQRTPKKD